MAEFLCGPKLDEAIKKILREPGCRAAVAFWGRESERRLPQNGKGDFQVICNLMSGGTNPHAIEKLKRENVRQCDTLHAKVFLGGKEAVVASANVSANGLGLEGGEQAMWIEAGVRITETAEIERWMDDLWDNRSRKINDEDINLAKQKWAQRQRAKPTRKSLRDVEFDDATFPIVYWEGNLGKWHYNDTQIAAQGISREDVAEGLEARGNDDTKVMWPGRWVLVWQRRKDGMPAKTPAPYWFQCGASVKSTFQYEGEDGWLHTVRSSELVDPEPFDIKNRGFLSLFADVISRKEFDILRTDEDSGAWLKPKRVAMMREFWRALQAEVRKPNDAPEFAR